ARSHSTSAASRKRWPAPPWARSACGARPRARRAPTSPAAWSGPRRPSTRTWPPTPTCCCSPTAATWRRGPWTPPTPRPRLGDPLQQAPTPVKGQSGLRTLLKDDQGQVVRTRLEEELLRQIARRTRGRYLAVGTGSLDVDRFIAEVLGTRPTRELKKGGQGRMYVHRF